MTEPITPAAPAGWYPDGSGQQRYWDGSTWTAHFAPLTAPDAAPTEVLSPAVGVTHQADGQVAAVATLAPAKKKKKWPWIVGGAAAVILLFGIIGSLNGAGDKDVAADKKPAAVAEQVDEPAAQEVDTTVEIPDMTGMTVGQAKAALALVNITLTLPAEVTDDWVVSSQSVPGGGRIEPGDPLSISAAAPQPVYTVGQQNAISKAKSYLSFAGFSRSGLIEQLEFEGYSTEDATFGADNAGADWNAEAAQKAKSYMELTAFSRDGLYEQMAFEGFTDSEIQAGLAAVGY